MDQIYYIALIIRATDRITAGTPTPTRRTHGRPDAGTLGHCTNSVDRADAAGTSEGGCTRARGGARLGLLERGDARQHLALEELERRAAARRDVRHALRDARLLDGRDRVAAADDGGTAAVGQVGEHVRDRERARGERVHLEDAHRPVPHDGARAFELGADRVDAARPHIEAHQARRHRAHRHHLRRRVRLERGCDDSVDRQKQPHAARFRLRQGLG
mmetsp:Transcript_9349/g.22432  ORF Transcript_9349/g.22432 Transcript_9349/m.22432 type:complete len:217 (+) Transcript_9349:130-780(+)